MTDGPQEKSATDTSAKPRTQGLSKSSGLALAEKRRENKLRKKMAHRRAINRSHTTG